MKRPSQFALATAGAIAFAVAVIAAVPKQKLILSDPDLAGIPVEGDGFILDNGFLLIRIDSKNIMDVVRGFERLKREKMQNTLRIASYGDVMPNAWNFRRGLGAIVFPWDQYTYTTIREAKGKTLGQYVMMPGDYVPEGMVYVAFRAPEPPKPEEPIQFVDPSADTKALEPVVAKAPVEAPEPPVPTAANTGG